MNRLRLVACLFVTLCLCNFSVIWGMVQQREKKLALDVASPINGDDGLIADYWFAIEDVGLPLDATVFEGKFTIEQMIDFLKTIKGWQTSYPRQQTMKRLVRIFSEKYKEILFTEDQENVFCAVCGKKYKLYAPCVRHILIKHFYLNQAFRFAKE